MSASKPAIKLPGTAPGTLIYTGAPRNNPITITIIDYNDQLLNIKRDATLAECGERGSDSNSVTWINVDGIHDTRIIESLGRTFDLHRLVLEDIVHPHHRPKAEGYDDHLFFVLKMLHYQESLLKVEQMSLIVGQNYLISFQEYSGDVLDPIRARLEQNLGIMRRHGTDYLAYAIVDTLVDHYIHVTNQLADEVESLEDAMISKPAQSQLAAINQLKRQTLTIGRICRPTMEFLKGINRDQMPLITKKTQIYLRDVYDHVIHVMDLIDSLRDYLGGLNDHYFSSISLRLNQTMSFLTIMGSIFIPLTFLAGIWGMNFSNMPELTWRYGYPMALGSMLLVGAVLVIFFKKRKWF